MFTRKLFTSQRQLCKNSHKFCSSRLVGHTGAVDSSQQKQKFSHQKRARVAAAETYPSQNPRILFSIPKKPKQQIMISAQQQVDLVADLSEDTLRKGFHDIYPELSEFLIADSQNNFEVTNAHASYIKRMIDYTCLGGKCNRGLMVQQTLVNAKKAQKQGVTQDELRQARVVGWCIEWLQAFFLVADDIMDQSVMRRNQPCWYRLPDVKLVACNDYIMLEAQIYRMLKKYLGSDKEKYISVVDLFHDTTMQTIVGQMFDTRNQHQSTKKPEEKSAAGLDFSVFTLEEYKRIVKYKTAYYSFYLPVAAGLVVAGVSDAAVYKETEQLMVMMGEYFQIQDDFLDCYADPKVLGKVGRDIEEGKCSWLVVQALKRVNDEQLAVLHNCYGTEAPENVAKVKQFYKDLNMEQVFKDYENKAEEEMIAFIDKSILKQKGMEVIYNFALKLIMKRQK